MDTIDKIINEFHSGNVMSVDYIPETDYIVSGSADKTIKIWNYKTQELVSTLQGHTNTVRQVKSIHDT